LLVTRDYQYAISPERPVLFLEAFAQLRGAVRDDAAGEEAGWQPAALTGRFIEAGWTTPYSSTASPSFGGSVPADQPRPLLPVETGRSAALPRLWSDPVASGLLIAALVLDIALTLFILVRYDHFPEMIAIHWDSRGMADRFAPTRHIWTIPLITWLVTIANVAIASVVDGFDRFSARFLLAASLAVELAALIALYWMIR
jgi:hypothetical protein